MKFMQSWGGLMFENSRMECQGHLQRALKIARIANDLGYGIKLNTVVTSANYSDDMTEIVKQINPTRWKIFQVLKIEDENDGRVEALLISESVSINILNAICNPLPLLRFRSFQKTMMQC